MKESFYSPTVPTLLLDEDRCKRNISRMAAKAKAAGCVLRPHFKTHQSHTVGSWFRDVGVKGITVSSTKMAQYFARDGWKDITIAFPFYPAQLDDLQELEKHCKLRLFVNSTDSLERLNRALEHPFDIVVEIDTGYGRSGIPAGNISLITELIAKTETLPNSRFHGFYIHEGRTYQAKGNDQIEKVLSPSIFALKKLKKQFSGASVSLGDTPSASVLDPSQLDGIDELTPGNFVFYDWMQVQIGSCSLNDVCLFVLLPFAQKPVNGTQAILHGGAVHLSKDFIEIDGQKNYGQAIEFSENSSIRALDRVFLSSLSQEHGTLTGLSTLQEKEYANLNTICICPIHSCLTANLFDHYTTFSGKRIEKRVLS